MATARLAPDAILEQVNSSGAVSAIQDDPDAPDTSWLTCPDPTSNGAVRVSFPTPDGTLTGTQEVRARVRPTATGTNAGTAALELYENGVLVATLQAATTISASQVLAGTFSAAQITNPANVEARVNFTSGSGKATGRKSVEIGAIEWNATSEVAQAPALSGTVTVSGTGSTTTAGAASKAGSVAIAATGFVMATGAAETPAEDYSGAVVVSGTSSATLSGTASRSGSVSLSATGSGTATGGAEIPAEAYSGTTSVAAIGAALFAGTSTRSGSVALISTGSVVSHGFKTEAGQIAGSVRVTATAQGSASGVAARYGALLLSGHLSLVLSGVPIQGGVIVEVLHDLAEKGQVAARSILSADEVEQALIKRLEKGSVVAHTVVGRAR